MLPDIFVFNKTLSERLEEYKELFNDVNGQCSDIIDIWRTIIEMHAFDVNDNIDWQALWVPMKKNCIKYDLLYPSAITVKINECHWDLLEATVTVEDVKGVLPSSDVIRIPIIELYPIKEQDYNERNLEILSDWLDKCRYFFRYLWYPWDEKKGVDIKDWVYAHLRSRLELQYDCKTGILGPFAKNYIKSLLNESQEIEILLNKIDNNYQGERCKIVKYCMRWKEIESELMLLENPDLGLPLIEIKEKEESLINPPRKNDLGEFRLVWTGGPDKEFSDFYESARLFYQPHATLKISDSLQDTFNKCEKDDVIFVCEGEHLVKSLGKIKEGGFIRGFSSTNVTIKSDSSFIKYAILFDSYGPLTLSNLTIIRKEGTCIQVCESSLDISDCKIIAENSSKVDGIIVSPNCSLKLENCELYGFETGIFVHEGADVKIINTQIHDCGNGIEVKNDVKLWLEDVEISSCSKYGLKIKSLKVDSAAPLVGNIDIIENHEGFKFKSVSLTANKKGNVILKKVESDDENFIEFEVEEGEFEDTIYLSDDSDCQIESVTVENNLKVSLDFESGDHDASK